MKLRFFGVYQSPKANTVPFAETLTIQAKPSAAALTPARPAAELTRNHAKSKFNTTMIPTVFQLISFRFLEKSHPIPRKTINPIMLIIRYIDMAVYPP